MIKKFILILGITAILSRFFLAKVKAEEFYQSSMQGNSTSYIDTFYGNNHPVGDANRVAGLTWQVQDAGGPTLIMNEGAAPGPRDHIGPFPLMFGKIQTDSTGGLSSQTPNNVSNKLLFAGDLAVTLSRLSPAVLLETGRTQLSLFLPDADSTKNDIDNVQAHLATTPETNDTVINFLAAGLAAGGTIKPLRYAAPKADGTVQVGVLGTQTAVALPIPGISKTTSLASSPSSPPLDQLGSKWLLLWYGADSIFLSTKTPFARIDNLYLENDSTLSPKPWWPVKTEPFQADIPILVILNQNPSGVSFNSSTGITFNFSSGPVKIAVMPLFGRKILKAADTEQWLKGLPTDVTAQVNNWAARLSQFPNGVTETVSYDSTADKTTFNETVSFTQVRTGGAAEAPLPPMLALAKDQGLAAVSFSSTPLNTNLATEFGPIYTIPASSYSWSISGLGKYVNQQVTLGPSNSLSKPWEDLLDKELDKFVPSKTHLAPYIFAMRSGGTAYFRDPAENLYYLANLLPVLDSTRQQQLKDYLIAEKTTYDPLNMNYLHLSQTWSPPVGTPRTVWDMTNWLYPQGQDYYSFENPIPRHTGGQLEINEFWEESPQSLYRAYSLSRYYQAVSQTPPSSLLTYCDDKLNYVQKDEQWDTLSWFWGKYIYLRWDGYLEVATRSVDRNLAGVVGCISLYKQSGQTAPANYWKLYAKLAALRYAMIKYERYLAVSGVVGLPDSSAFLPDGRKIVDVLQKWSDFTNPDNYILQVRQLSQYGVSLGTGANRAEGFGGQQTAFWDMVPETGRLLKDWGLGPDIKRYLDFYNKRQPDWYRNRPAIAEGLEWRFAYPSDSYQLFMANAWIAGTASDQLARYVSVPWMDKGDLYYLQKLAETIKAYRNSSIPSVIPTPAGDINGDGKIDAGDLFIILKKYLTTDNLSDLNKDGIVNFIDGGILINNIGK